MSREPLSENRRHGLELRDAEPQLGREDVVPVGARTDADALTAGD
jgi:hypothetical protein